MRPRRQVLPVLPADIYINTYTVIENVANVAYGVLTACANTVRGATVLSFLKHLIPNRN